MRMRFSRIFQWLNGIHSFAFCSLSLWAPNIKLFHTKPKKKLNRKQNLGSKHDFFPVVCSLSKPKILNCFQMLLPIRGCCFFCWLLHFAFERDAGDVAVCTWTWYTRQQAFMVMQKSFSSLDSTPNVYENKRQTNETAFFSLLIAIGWCAAR